MLARAVRFFVYLFIDCMAGSHNDWQMDGIPRLLDMWMDEGMSGLVGRYLRYLGSQVVSGWGMHACTYQIKSIGDFTAGSDHVLRIHSFVRSSDG